MNIFLILIILLLCGGAFYEHTQQEETHATDQQQIADAEAKVDPLTTANQKLQDENKALQTKLTDETKTADDLNTQVVALKKMLAPPLDVTGTNSAASNGPGTTASGGSDPNALGTITTVDQKTFLDCHLLKVEKDGLTFRHSEGITKVLFPYLSPALQKKYGFDPFQTTPTANP